MSKVKFLAGMAILVALSACTDPNMGMRRGQGINANCTLLGAAGGAALGAVTDNNIAQSAIAGGVGGALAGNAGLCN